MKNAILSGHILVLSIAASLPAATRLVPDEYATIQAAIDDANDGDVVIVEPGRYTGDGNRDIDFLGKAIIVRSTDPNDPNIVAATAIDCQGSKAEPHRAFCFHSGEGPSSVLAGLTVTKGYADYGAGIYVEFNSGPTLTNCVLTDNTARSDGGGMLTYGNPSVANCIFSGNSARWGGGICDSGGNLKIINSSFSENLARHGGGIYHYVHSHAAVVNCVFAGNAATENGGGIFNNDSTPILINCMFIDNSAACVGGGVYTDIRAKTALTNSILTNNTDGGGADESAQIYSAKRGVSIVNYCCIQGWTGALGGAGNIGADPMFVYPTRNDFHLLPNSPCINAGDPNYVPVHGETDIDGDPRVLDGRVDIGPDEFAAPTAPVIGVSANSFKFRVPEAAGDPPSQILAVQNIGADTVMSWTITEDCHWLDIHPITGESSGETDEVTLSVNASGKPAGLYYTDLMISGRGAINSPWIVRIALHVCDADGELHVPLEYNTIQAAIDVAVHGDTVVVAPGRYTGDGNGDIDFQGKAITVRSTDPNDPNVVAATVLDGRWGRPDCHHGFIFRNGEGRDSVIEGLTITEFRAAKALFSDLWAAAGGGVFCRGSSPTISRCVIKSNYDGPCETQIMFGGGGIYCDEGSSPRIVRCTIIDNHGNLGGGGIHCEGGNPIIDHCTIIGNYSGWDIGGIFCYAGATIMNCTISNNHGGGIHCGGNALVSHCVISGNTAEGGVRAIGNATITDSTIIGNRARRCGMNRKVKGGGIYCRDNVTVSNCLIAGNWSELCPADELWPEFEGNGGGIYCERGNPTITSCTIANNAADDNGGGIYSTGNAIVTNCIIWSNNSPNEPQVSGQVTASYSDIGAGWPGAGNTDADPYFTEAGHWAHKNDPNIALEPDDPNAAWLSGNYHLKSQAGRWDPATQAWVKDDLTSPCIDAGDPMSPIGYEPFPNGGIVNMGAYGGTAEASKSFFGEPICETIVAGDINGDCKVDSRDLALMAAHWLTENR